MAPTLCEGSRCSTGKAKPVTLVARRLSRNTTVHPSRLRPRSSPIMTMTPEAMPTRLRATWSPVKVGVVMPQIIVGPARSPSSRLHLMSERPRHRGEWRPPPRPGIRAKSGRIRLYVDRPDRPGPPVHVHRPGAPDPHRESGGHRAHPHRHLPLHQHSGHRSGLAVQRTQRGGAGGAHHHVLRARAHHHGGQHPAHRVHHRQRPGHHQGLPAAGGAARHRQRPDHRHLADRPPAISAGDDPAPHHQLQRLQRAHPPARTVRARTRRTAALRPQLVTIPGVAIPYPYGGKQRQVMVDLDTRMLQAKGLAPNDVLNALALQSLVLPSGTAKIGQFEYDVSLNAAPRTVPELGDLPIKVVGNSTIYERDVANVRDGFSVQTNIVRRDGRRGTLLTVLKAGDASTLDVVGNIRKAIPRVASTLPPELQIDLLADQSIFVRGAVMGVIHEAI